MLEYQGRPDLEHVPGRGRLHEWYSPPAQRLGYFAGVPGRWPARLIDQFDAEEQAFAPDVSDQGVAFGERQQAVAEVGADFRGVGHQALVLDDGQDGERGRAGDPGCCRRCWNSSTSSGTAPSSWDLTTRAATGKPLPIGLPITTMSGTIPDAWKLHRCVPDRP